MSVGLSVSARVSLCRNLKLMAMEKVGNNCGVRKEEEGEGGEEEFEVNGDGEGRE